MKIKQPAEGGKLIFKCLHAFQTAGVPEPRDINHIAPINFLIIVALILKSKFCFKGFQGLSPGFR